MRALVTGAGGFVGSHLVERLEADGHEVFSARRADYDLTRERDAERLFADARPEVVFHLAAEVGGIGANRDRWVGRVDWLGTGKPTGAAQTS